MLQVPDVGFGSRVTACLNSKYNAYRHDSSRPTLFLFLMAYPGTLLWFHWDEQGIFSAEQKTIDSDASCENLGDPFHYTVGDFLGFAMLQDSPRLCDDVSSFITALLLVRNRCRASSLMLNSIPWLFWPGSCARQSRRRLGCLLLRYHSSYDFAIEVEMTFTQLPHGHGFRRLYRSWSWFSRQILPVGYSQTPKKKNSLGVHLRIILVSPSLYPVLSEFIMSKKN